MIDYQDTILLDWRSYGSTGPFADWVERYLLDAMHDSLLPDEDTLTLPMLEAYAERVRKNDCGYAEEQLEDNCRDWDDAVDTAIGRVVDAVTRAVPVQHASPKTTQEIVESFRYAMEVMP